MVNEFIMSRVRYKRGFSFIGGQDIGMLKKIVNPFPGSEE